MKRRDFLRASALTTGAIALSQSPAGALRRAVAMNDRIQIGVIGCKGMGWSNVVSLLKMEDVDLVANVTVSYGTTARYATSTSR